jgi:hypothetical protein
MDAENAPEFEKSCQSWIGHGITSLVVDVAELEYVSSMGLRSFMSVGKTLQDRPPDWFGQASLRDNPAEQRVPSARVGRSRARRGLNQLA